MTVAAEVPAVPISALIPAELRKGLIDLAREHQTTLSSELREAITAYLVQGRKGYADLAVERP